MANPKLPCGRANLHLLESHGGSASTYNFYSTNYSKSYRNAKDWNLGRVTLQPGRTGFNANCRPAIFYSPQQDVVDKSPMGISCRQLLKDNYESQTSRDFIGYKGPDPKATLPSLVLPHESGFSHNQPPTRPTQQQVDNVHVDTRPNLGHPHPIYPRERPVLHSIQDRDPVAKENSGHGPKAMSTEYVTQFVDKKFRADGKGRTYCNQDIGESAYTHAYNPEPVTFKPFENYSGELPGYMTWRPTGNSVTKMDFNPSVYKMGNEPLQPLTSRCELSNGFTKGNKAQTAGQPKATDMVGYRKLNQLHPVVQEKVKRDDPAEYSILAQPHGYTTLSKHTFQGLQRPPPPSESQRLGREEVGPKEHTGFCHNNHPYVLPQDWETKARFSTQYQDKFHDPSPEGYHRHGYVANGGGVQPLMDNIYTCSTQVHSNKNPSVNSPRKIHPYVERSMTRRDPYMNDLPHIHKMQA